MRSALILLLFSFGVYAKPVVVLSYFDAFGMAPFNASEKVAQRLQDMFKNSQEIDLRLCALRTVFDKAFYDLEDCLRPLAAPADLVLSLGESGCNLKLELLARNIDKSAGPDNEGTERNNSPIDPAGPREIGLTYPLAQMYCSLEERERKVVDVSNHAGSFVCNNLTYHVARNYPELKFGFIHVPANSCPGLDARTDSAVRALERMVRTAISHPAGPLPTKKKELRVLREKYKNDRCLSEFYGRARGVDEKGLWALF